MIPESQQLRVYLLKEYLIWYLLLIDQSGTERSSFVLGGFNTKNIPFNLVSKRFFSQKLIRLPDHEKILEWDSKNDARYEWIKILEDVA